MGLGNSLPLPVVDKGGACPLHPPLVPYLRIALIVGKGGEAFTDGLGVVDSESGCCVRVTIADSLVDRLVFPI